MYWRVDSGSDVAMYSTQTDGAHKEAYADVSGWNWNSTGLYTLTFTAKDTAQNTIATKQIIIKVKQSITTVPTTGLIVPSSTQSTQSIVTPIIQTGSTTQPAINTQELSNLKGLTLYVHANSPAADQAVTWRNVRPADAASMDILAAQPTATWIGSWNTDVYKDVRTVMVQAQKNNSTPVFVAYNIPDRDCGGYSAGGINSVDGYRAWTASFAAAIGSTSAIVVLEPDALANMTCLSLPDKDVRLNLLSQAVQTFRNNAHTSVYLDAGHSGWIDPITMAGELQKAGIAQANGFSLNVSNFQSATDSIAYGAQLSQRLNNKHFVIDSSRNGNGPDTANNWCNPSGRSIGIKPTTVTGNPLIDAYLWIKTPGESDGNCNGGPGAGQWWGQYALDLVTRSTSM